MIRSDSHRARGQALVEFALVFPIFLLLVFGLIDVGRYVYTANAINQGAREGARYGSVAAYAAGCNLGRDACIQQETLGRVAAIPASTVDVSCARQTGAGTVLVADADACRTADFLIVEVRTPFHVFTPLIAQIIGTQTLVGRARVVVNN